MQKSQASPAKIIAYLQKSGFKRCPGDNDIISAETNTKSHAKIVKKVLAMLPDAQVIKPIAGPTTRRITLTMPHAWMEEAFP